MDLVEEEDVKVVGQKMVIVMSRCGWGGLSSMVGRVAIVKRSRFPTTSMISRASIQHPQRPAFLQRPDP